MRTTRRDLIRLASLYESSGNMDAALELCKEALTKEPESSFIATKLDMLFQQRQDKDEAIRFWRSFSDLHPEVALPWFYLGLCLERAGDKVGVRAAYTKAMEIKPDITIPKVTIEICSSGRIATL